jgi:hypothetical protein
MVPFYPIIHVFALSNCYSFETPNIIGFDGFFISTASIDVDHFWTALYKYIHSPFTLIYDSSILQEFSTDFFLLLNVPSINGMNLYTHLCIEA